MRSKRQTVPTTRRSQIGQQRRSVGGGWEEKFDMSDVKVAFEGGEGERDFDEEEDTEGEEEAEVHEEDEKEEAEAEVETEFKEETEFQWRSESSLGDCEAKLSEMVGCHFFWLEILAIHDRVKSMFIWMWGSFCLPRLI